MYTGLRFTAKLNDKGVVAVKALLASIEAAAAHSRWWVNYWEDAGALLVQIDDQRVSLIVGVGGQTDWNVCCAVKNYNSTIDKFLRLVLPLMISEPCLIETLYEEDLVPQQRLVLPAVEDIDAVG